ncbi:MAG TPA: response regulator transcription factor [Candidatus Caccenecus avistercoris]|nr:response regulator transcription factor [Candidatus Caccenecus avistercoris]
MKILIVEDDLKIREELKILLEREGYQVEVLSSFLNTVEDIRCRDYDLLLLDINLPDKNGFTICKEIKKDKQTPIIFVTSRNTEEDELNSILSGGDDFVTKPYNKYILLEKIGRALKLNDPTRYKELVVHDVILDLHLSKIKYHDQEVELTRNEFRILYYLFLNVGQVLSKEKLIEYLWNDAYYLDETILLVNINRLRKKLEDMGLKDFVKTKRGVGYFI